MDNLVDELGIPKKYLKSTNREDRFSAIVHKSWLKSLLKHSRLVEVSEKLKLDSWPHVHDAIEESWQKIYVRIFKKRDAKVIPLPRIPPKSIKSDTPLMFSQLMQYITQTNHKNLWKDAYKKYNLSSESNRSTQVTLCEYNQVIREIILRTYGCAIVNTCDYDLGVDASDSVDAHSNVYGALCAVETLNAIFLIHPHYVEHNLYDCLTFSPSILEKCYTKPLFLVYQLVNTLRTMHERSLTIGDITLHDIYLSDDLWLFIFPQLCSNIHVQDVPRTEKVLNYDCRKSGHKYELTLKCANCGDKTYDKLQVRGNESLEQLCKLWIHAQISNYTYLMALNALSGRKFADPNCHYVFPWVTDFTERNGKHWRDMKKSKFRLNKGDRQLDLTYEHVQDAQVPHHVSDVLSSITYYVYMARRTPKSVLCKNVRTNWVPAEYPSSIQRLQEWTPDECIPEFFNDPMIFKSVHDDLGDLDVPPWSSSPEDFIDKHRETLESQHVSERLHHWIDLTFGYKLSGNAAIKSKNVCLHLVDGHTNLTSSGVVQLFLHPHPPRTVNMPFWGKIPPKVYPTKQIKNRDLSTSSTTLETSRSEEEDPSLDDESLTSRPLALSRLLSRSRSSLNEDTKRDEKSRSSSSQRSASVGPKNATFTSHVPSQKTHLPKEFNPSVALLNLENIQTFFTKTFHTEAGKRYRAHPDPEQQTHRDEKQHVEKEELQVQNAFTNRLFQDLATQGGLHQRATKSFTFPIDNQNILPFRQSRARPVQKVENQITCHYSDIIAKRRTREMQILGCLIVEIFMQKQIRVLAGNGNHLRFKERRNSCLTVLNSCKHEIPNCIRHLVHALLQPNQDSINFDEFKYTPISDCGLPPPSAHLLLEPLLHSMIPFNEHFLKLYGIISMLKDYENVNTELEILYNFNCDGELCAKYETVERTKLLLTQNIAECKVKSCANKLDDLIDDLNATKDSELVNIVVQPIRHLIEDAPTAVLSAWYLFDSIARSLGPKRSVEMLLQPILRLYEHETSDSNIPHNSKIARLYHHSFLLRLIVRFGLRTFLDHFITPLVEAVGGYRDLLEEKTFILHTHSDKHSKKTNLKSIVSETHELSPSDDSSESDSKNTSKEPEVFHFDGEEVLEQLQSNIATDLPFNHSIAEEALDTLETDELAQHTTEYKGLMSPTIPIPSRKEVSNISCDVGSKKSDSDFPIESDYRDFAPSSASHQMGASKNERPKNEARISSMATESVIWLSHRLGPVLTARYLSRNLLKMLTLCYVGKDNLIMASKMETNSHADFISIACSRVVGDNNAAKVLECLASIAALYGHQLILYQYLPHMSELIALCKRKLTANLEGGLISCLALLKHIIPYISDTTLMENLQDVILKNILYPTIRLLGSTKYTFPNGAIARNVLARKYLDTLYVLSLRMGATMTHTHLAVPALQRFFLIFDKIIETPTAAAAFAPSKQDASTPANLDESDVNFIEVCRDGTLAEWAIGGRPVHISRLRDSDSTDSLSPPQSKQPPSDDKSDCTVNLALNELQAVFTADLAHTAYMPFMKQIGLPAMESSLKNYERIISLTQEYEMELLQTSYRKLESEQQVTTENRLVSGSIGSNIALIGNRIDVQDDEEHNADMLNYVSNKIENTQRHLRGNWLAYWEHEIGRSDKDTQFNFKQIKLQTFTGHTNSVKSLYILDNENSFLSASKDKTVKLWSLRSQGDGTSSSTCQSTYSVHKKGVFAISFLEGLRLVASCDGVVHLWDPFMCASVGQLESAKYAPVHVLKSLPAPSSLLFAASSECTVKVIDARICNYVHDLKVAINQGIWIRCLAIGPAGNWVATGLCSGQITVLDTRTGLVLSTWRAHDSEIVQLVPADDDTLISSGMDQLLHVWNVNDGKFKFSMKGATEPVHCLNVNNSELISGTTGNRIGVHTSIDADASFSSTKLRSDAFKGALVSMAMLPLNRLLLLGADTGIINLLC